MKKQILLLLGWVLGMQVVLGQTGNDDRCKAPEQCDVVYDFAAKKFTSLPVAKHGQPIVFRVDNVNSLTYKVEIVAKQLLFTSEPSQFTKLVFGMEDETKIHEQGVRRSPRQTDSIPIDSIASFSPEPKEILIDSLEELADSKAAVIRMLYRDLDDLVFNKNELIRMSTQNGVTAIEVENVVKDIQRWDRKSIIESELDLPAHLDKYWEVVRELKRLSGSENDSTHRDIYFAQIEKRIKRIDYSKIYEDLLVLKQNLGNENNFIVISDPVQAEGDAMLFNIKITAREGLDLPVTLDEREFTIEVPVRGGMKIDFSTGLMLTRWQQDRSYAVSEIDSSTAEIVRNAYHGFGTASLGGLMHISSRSEKGGKFAGTLGFGLNSKDITEANIFLGGSYIFGRREQFVVSSGLSLAQVDYLKGKYKLGARYLKEDLSANDLTTKTMRPGIFVGLTYNLTKEKEE